MIFDVNDKENNLLNAKQIAAFKTGQYGKDFHVYDTDEANSRSWDVFSKMLVKENSSTKVIEDKMGFKFKDLMLIGKVESLYMTKMP